MTAQKISHTVDTSSSNLISTNSTSQPKADKNIFQQPDPSSFPPKQKQTQTVRGQALEEEKNLKQAKINA